MDPVLGMMAASAGAGLLQSLMNQQSQEESDRRALALAREQQAKQALQQAQQNQLSITGQAGDREQNAIQQLINVFQRSAR
jgi:hypothetical protein